VRELAVIAESLTVIPGNDDDRPIALSRSIQPLEHARDLRVGERDLAVVGASARLCEELLRRIVRRMRIVEMNPREERLRSGAPEPAERGVHHHVAAALRLE